MTEGHLHTATSIADFMRRRILSDLHLGRIDPGHRLPSIRDVATMTGADHRTVGRAYERLREEGLVEIRSRSGVFVAPQDHLGQDGGIIGETARWLSYVATDAWARRIALPTLPDLIRRTLAARRLRCVFVESQEDLLEAFAMELEEDFGLAVERMLVEGGYEALTPESEQRVKGALGRADIVSTSIYHGAAIERMAAEAGIVPIVVRLDRDWLEELRLRLSANEPVTLVAEDRRVRDRLGDIQNLGERDFTIVPADEWRGGPDPDVFFTPAAMKRLGYEGVRRLPPRGPVLARDAALALASTIIVLNLGRESDPDPLGEEEREAKGIEALPTPNEPGVRVGDRTA